MKKYTREEIERLVDAKAQLKVSKRLVGDMRLKGEVSWDGVASFYRIEVDMWGVRYINGGTRKDEVFANAYRFYSYVQAVGSLGTTAKPLGTATNM